MEVDELFRKLRPALGSKIDALWLEYQLKPNNRREIEGLLNVLAMQHLGQGLQGGTPLLLPPDAATASTRRLSATNQRGPEGSRHRKPALPTLPRVSRVRPPARFSARRCLWTVENNARRSP
jgi:hypothetical protein